MTGGNGGMEAEKKRRIKIHETTLENDIRYRGPLSPTHFKILGWLCIVIAQVAALIRLAGRIDAGFGASSASWLNALDNIAALSLPFLLIVNFAQLLNAHDGYRKQLILNSAAMAGICALFYLVFYRYFVGGLAALLKEPSEALPAVKTMLSLFLPYGFASFNIFVDLFLCTLTMIFLNYNPRRVFVGKARFIFRLFALLPIGYEVGCMVLKLYAAKCLIQIPVWAYPLLTVKPPMTFVLFVALVLFVKTRELRFRRHGKTHEEYKAFLKTRRNSWNFSVFLAIMLVLVSAADLAVVFGFSLGEVSKSLKAGDEAAQIEEVQDEAAPSAEIQIEAASGEEQEIPEELKLLRDQLELSIGDESAPTEELTEEEIKALEEAEHEAQINASIDSGIRLAYAVGFGGSAYLFLLAPLVLLLSYTRKPKNRLLDTLIPVAGVALILLVYIEGIHQLLGVLPIPKLDLQEIKEMITVYGSLLM